MYLAIINNIQNTKTSHFWAKKITSVNLKENGGYALIGKWIPKTSSISGNFLSNAQAGTLIVIGYRGTGRYSEAWTAVTQIADPITIDEKENLTVHGGNIIWLGSNIQPQQLALDAARRAANSTQLEKAQNTNYAAALVIKEHLQSTQIHKFAIE